MTSRDDRAEGVLLATAAGDALGAPYEFQPARGPELEVAMVGGGGWEPGEWTDDTSMAIAIAEVAATGADLRDETAQDDPLGRGARGSRHSGHGPRPARRVARARQMAASRVIYLPYEGPTIDPRQLHKKEAA